MRFFAFRKKKSCDLFQKTYYIDGALLCAEAESDSPQAFQILLCSEVILYTYCSACLFTTYFGSLLDRETGPETPNLKLLPQTSLISHYCSSHLFLIWLWSYLRSISSLKNNYVIQLSPMKSNYKPQTSHCGLNASKAMNGLKWGPMGQGRLGRDRQAPQCSQGCDILKPYIVSFLFH